LISCFSDYECKQFPFQVKAEVFLFVYFKKGGVYFAAVAIDTPVDLEI